MRSYETAVHPSTNLYLVRHPWEPWLKVGIAKNVKQRMGTYVHAWGRGLPHPPVVVPEFALHLIGFLDARDMEFRVLSQFRADVVLNEWLRLTPEVEYLEAICENGDIGVMRRYFGVRHREQIAA